MSTEQINIRLDAELASALERVAREEGLDRAQAIRRLLGSSIKQWQLERALLGYRRGELSLGRAAEEAGLTQWELIDAARTAGLAYPLTGTDVEQRLRQLAGEGEVGEAETLPDIPPKAGGVLLVGINPAPVSIAAGHYYQGRIGQRLWRRLQRIGLLDEPIPGAEDEAFARLGHGLTDLVKRVTRSSAELTEQELRDGVEPLRAKLREWRPGLILFAFAAPARRLLGRNVRPGPGPDFEGIPTFLLSGPYAPRADADQIDDQLRRLLSASSEPGPEPPSERSQPITAHDIEAGMIRLPREAKRFFPAEKSTIEVVLRGVRLTASYDPRTGPDRDRSAVLRVGTAPLRRLVRENEILRVRRGLGGILLLE
jgi:TDG/mug DNA glycosylase family protein